MNWARIKNKWKKKKSLRFRWVKSQKVKLLVKKMMWSVLSSSFNDWQSNTKYYYRKFCRVHSLYDRKCDLSHKNDVVRATNYFISNFLSFSIIIHTWRPPFATRNNHSQVTQSVHVLVPIMSQAQQRFFNFRCTLYLDKLIDRVCVC